MSASAALSDERVLQGRPAAVVAATNITRRYGAGHTAVDALRGVSLEVGRGQLVAVMGPSGSGKSTLMHVLAGLDKPSSGTVEIDGAEITSLGDSELTKLRRRHIGFVFQFFNLLPMLTAEENVALPLSIAGEKPDAGWLDELFERTGLTQRRRHRPSELSGGEQQRVAIARSLINRPTILLAGEPTAIALVLGVAMVSGTYILTDTIKAACSTVFTNAYRNADAVVTGRSALGNENSNGGRAAPPALPGSLLTRIQRLPEVAVASGGVADQVGLVGHNRKVIARGGAPGLAFSYTPAGQRFSPLSLASGHYPAGPDQVDIDAETASKQHYSVGQQIGVIARGPEERFTVVGTVKFGGVSSLGGATLALFTLSTAQRLFNKPGQFDQINIDAKRGVSPQQIVGAVRPSLPATAPVRTG